MALGLLDVVNASTLRRFDASREFGAEAIFAPGVDKPKALRFEAFLVGRGSAVHGSICTAFKIWEFPKISGTLLPYPGVLIRRILLFGALYSGPLFSETPIYNRSMWI